MMDIEELIEQAEKLEVWLYREKVSDYWSDLAGDLAQALREQQDRIDKLLRDCDGHLLIVSEQQAEIERLKLLVKTLDDELTMQQRENWAEVDALKAEIERLR